jgi:hypothetical protein
MDSSTVGRASSYSVNCREGGPLSTSHLVGLHRYPNWREWAAAMSNICCTSVGVPMRATSSAKRRELMGIGGEPTVVVCRVAAARRTEGSVLM